MLFLPGLLGEVQQGTSDYPPQTDRVSVVAYIDIVTSTTTFEPWRLSSSCLSSFLGWGTLGSQTHLASRAFLLLAVGHIACLRYRIDTQCPFCLAKTYYSSP